MTDSAPSLLTTVAVSAFTGFAGGLVAWATGVFLSKPLARFFELRLEAHKLMYVSANVIDTPEERPRAEKVQADLHALAAEIDAPRSSAAGSTNIDGSSLPGVGPGGRTRASDPQWIGRRRPTTSG
jgi:hypothetical protein